MLPLLPGRIVSGMQGIKANISKEEAFIHDEGDYR